MTFQVLLNGINNNITVNQERRAKAGSDYAHQCSTGYFHGMSQLLNPFFLSFSDFDIGTDGNTRLKKEFTIV